MDAAKTYEARRKEIAAKLEEIAKGLKNHAARQEADSGNWGFPGDLDYVVERLADVVEFLN
jgi:hypothetical protein